MASVAFGIRTKYLPLFFLLRGGGVRLSRLGTLALPGLLYQNLVIDECGAAGEMIRRGADKSLALSIFLFAAQPKEVFLGWVKEVRTTKS
jgi:hypothetical protein